MWCKCVSKYGICDINTVANINGDLSFTIAVCSHELPRVDVMSSVGVTMAVLVTEVIQE